MTARLPDSFGAATRRPRRPVATDMPTERAPRAGVIGAATVVAAGFAGLALLHLGGAPELADLARAEGFLAACLLVAVVLVASGWSTVTPAGFRQATEIGLPLLAAADGVAGVAMTGSAIDALPLFAALVALGAATASGWVTAGLVVLVTGAGAAAVPLAEDGSQLGLIAGLVTAAVLAASLYCVRRTDARALGRLRQELLAAEAGAVLDPLTGLANREGLKMLAVPMLEAARRRGDAVHCVVLAVDGLGAVNDRMGRQAGDDVLVATAGALRGVLRGTDVVGRWGGNELCIIGPGPGMTMLELERRVRDRLRQDPPVDRASWEPKVTAGGSVLAPWDDGDLDSLLNKADLETYARRALRGTATRRRRRADFKL